MRFEPSEAIQATVPDVHDTVSIFAREWQKMTGHEPEAVEAIRGRLAVAIRK